MNSIANPVVITTSQQQTGSSSPNAIQKKTFIDELIGEEVPNTDDSSGQHAHNAYRMKRTAQKTPKTPKGKENGSTPPGNVKRDFEMIVTKKLIITTTTNDESRNELSQSDNDSGSKMNRKSSANGTNKSTAASSTAKSRTKSTSASELSTHNETSPSGQPNLIKKEQLEYEFLLKPNASASQKKSSKKGKRKPVGSQSNQSSTKSNNQQMKESESKRSVSNSNFSLFYLFTACFRKQNNNFYCCYCFDAPPESHADSSDVKSTDKTATGDGASFTCKNCFSCFCVRGSRAPRRSNNVPSIYKEDFDKGKADLNTDNERRSKQSTSLFRNSKKRFSTKKGLASKKNSAKLAKDESLENEEFAEPPPITCIRVLRPSNDLTPVRFDSHYNIIQTLNANLLNCSDSQRSLNSTET